jgi:hypothetical protein
MNLDFLDAQMSCSQLKKFDIKSGFFAGPEHPSHARDSIPCSDLGHGCQAALMR